MAPRRRGVWKQAGALVAGHRWQVGLLGFLSFLGGVAEAVLLVLVARIAFALSEGSDAVSIAGTEVSVGRLLLLAAALPFVRLGLSAVASWQTAILTTRSMAEVRIRLFRGFLETSWEVQSQERLGHLQEVLTTAAYQTLLALRALASALESVLSLAALVVAALVVDLRGSLAIGVAVVALMIVLHPLRASVQRRSRAAAGAGSDFATSLTEHSTLAREIRVFGVEEQAARDVERSIEDHRRALARTHFTEQAAPAGYRSVALLLVVIALSVVYLADVSDLASLAAVVLIMVRALAYGQTLQVAVQALHQGAPYLETTEARARIYEAAAVDRSGDPLTRVDEVAFDAVSFAYEADRPVLDDISFRARRGELIGIVGPSGAGKTTLVQLLLRLREPTTGRVLADGRDAREVSLDDWYDRVGFAPQEPGLLTGTVYDNIAFFRPTDLPAVERAAALAQIHDEIEGWPEGYDTLVGERGAELSGGQRQRICLARALLAQPDVLVFDEPTSSLDARSEALFRTVVEERSSDAVVFVVAHRITTLRTCDRIMVLRDGVLEAFDSPAVLESSSPFFHEILRLSGLEPGAPTPTD